MDPSILAAFIGMPTSVVAIIYAARQSRHSAQATTVSTVQHFMLESQRLWRACEAARSESEYHFRIAVSDIMGHLEVITALAGDGTFRGRMDRLVTGTVRDYLDHMSQNGYIPYVTPLLDTPEVCENLRDFCLQRRTEFRHPEAVFEMLKLPRSSL